MVRLSKTLQTLIRTCCGSAPRIWGSCSKGGRDAANRVPLIMPSKLAERAVESEQPKDSQKQIGIILQMTEDPSDLAAISTMRRSSRRRPK